MGSEQEDLVEVVLLAALATCLRPQRAPEPVAGVSISALFTGGLLPGVVLAGMLAAVVWWRYRREDGHRFEISRLGGP